MQVNRFYTEGYLLNYHLNTKIVPDNSVEGRLGLLSVDTAEKYCTAETQRKIANATSLLPEKLFLLIKHCQCTFIFALFKDSPPKNKLKVSFKITILTYVLIRIKCVANEILPLNVSYVDIIAIKCLSNQCSLIV